MRCGPPRYRQEVAVNPVPADGEVRFVDIKVPPQRMDRCELMERMEQLYFRTSSEFRAWLVKHHATATELGVVLHRKTTGERSMTWSEAVNQALSVRGVDSVARRPADTRRVQPFTPRQPE